MHLVLISLPWLLLLLLMLLMSLPSHYMTPDQWLGECQSSGLISPLPRENAEDVDGVEYVLETPEIAYPPGSAI